MGMANSPCSTPYLSSVNLALQTSQMPIVQSITRLLQYAQETLLSTPGALALLLSTYKYYWALSRRKYRWLIEYIYLVVGSI